MTTYEVVAAILTLLTVFGFSRALNREYHKNEYAELRYAGVRMGLSFGALIIAFARSRNDPLRRAHRKIAGIGLLYLALTLISILLIWIVANNLIGG